MRLLLAILVALTFLIAAPAQAATTAPVTGGYLSPRPCATRTDYSHVGYQMTRTRVASLLHNRGVTISYHAIPRLIGWTTFRTQKYPVCTRASGYILVWYVNEREVRKYARW